MASTNKGAIKKTPKRGRDANENKNDRENNMESSLRRDSIPIINGMVSEHAEKEMEGREAERRERYFSCSNIEEEEELDEKTTKEKKRKIPGNLRIQLLRARTMNETNGSMIQARRTYVKNNETITPNTNIVDEKEKKTKKWKRREKKRRR